MKWRCHNLPRSRELLWYQSSSVGNNTDLVRQSFTNEYPDVRCPSRANIYYNVRKYCCNGTSCNLNKGNSTGRPNTERSAENIEDVRNAIEEANVEHLIGERPRLSCRQNRLGLSSATFNRITRLDFRFHPYQMIKQHQLHQGDHLCRLQFCRWLRDRNDHFLDDLLISDELGFALNAFGQHLQHSRIPTMRRTTGRFPIIRNVSEISQFLTVIEFNTKFEEKRAGRSPQEILTRPTYRNVLISLQGTI